MADQAVMAVLDVREAIEWQARHAEEAHAPRTARVIRAELAILDGDTATGRRMANWQGLVLADAMPLRIAGGLHWLCLSGRDRRLEPVYAGLLTDQKAIDRIVADLVVKYDALLMAWLDGPPQTNEAGRSASLMAGLLWFSTRLGLKFELSEIGDDAVDRCLVGQQAGIDRLQPPVLAREAQPVNTAGDPQRHRVGKDQALPFRHAPPGGGLAVENGQLGADHASGARGVGFLGVARLPFDRLAHVENRHHRLVRHLRCPFAAR